MDALEYKKYIESEYDEKNHHMYIVMYGNEGCEGFLEIHKPDDLKCLNKMELRARFNGQRNIGIYGISSETELTPDIINEELISNDKVKRIY